MFGALGFWQGVAALAALAQDHSVPVAGATAGCALQRRRRPTSAGRAKQKGTKTAIISVQGREGSGSEEEGCWKPAGHRSSAESVRLSHCTGPRRVKGDSGSQTDVVYVSVCLVTGVFVLKSTNLLSVVTARDAATTAANVARLRIRRSKRAIVPFRVFSAM